jgi:hypothetical protein
MSLFTQEQVNIINIYPLSITDEFRNRLPKDDFENYILSTASNRGKYLGLLIGIDAKLIFWNLLGLFSFTVPAILITLTDSSDKLNKRLQNLAEAWLEQEEFPTTLLPYCISLLEKVATKASDLDIWTAVAQLLIAFSSSKPLTPVAPSKDENGYTQL